MAHFSHFMSGTLVFVTYEIAAPGHLRKLPKRSAATIRRLPPRTVLEVLGGPAYDDGHIYWQTRVVASDQVGWTSQGTGEEIYLRPVIEHVVVPGKACSLLRPGDRATLPRRLPGAVPIRVAPGCDAETCDVIEPGGRLHVDDGPAIIDRRVWWRIHTDGGARGWLPERQGAGRLLWPIEVGYA